MLKLEISLESSRSKTNIFAVVRGIGLIASCHYIVVSFVRRCIILPSPYETTDNRDLSSGVGNHDLIRLQHIKR